MVVTRYSGVRVLAMLHILAIGAMAEEYAGTINGKLEIRMDLRFDGRNVSGTYFYEKQRKNLRLEGSVAKDGTLTLKEYHESGRTTGTFKGRRDGNAIEGTWSSPDRSKSFPFRVTRVVERNGWNGTWYRVGSTIFEPAEITIEQKSEKELAFDLNALCGTHIGNISEMAKLTGNRAVFEDDEGFTLTLTLADGCVFVSSRGNTSYYAGAGVSFDGEYRPEKDYRRPSLVELGALADENADRAFQKLVGDDYDLFRNSYQQADEEDDLDEMQAWVRSSFLRGGGSQAIVMVAPGEKIYAAATDGSSLKYYTNDKAGTKKLPKTISMWKDRVASDMPVVYVSAKGGK